MVDEKVVETVEEAKKIDEKKMAFYENLRKKITGFIGESVGEYKFTEYLLALPDFFILLCRLAVDDRVQKTQKAFVGAIIAYIIMPLDIIPDFIPVIGYMDDLILAVFGLNLILNEIDKQILLDNWSGKEDLLGLLQKITAKAEGFLDKNIIQKVKNLVNKYWKK
ncbi:MAG: DUF1232 domain-containing protein [Candidatus Cloacimonetes bacterium]|jgi:uncharacterized membrane protein YkvA (DUF1232 family)|nr:DUF1232 domain-containing protein [Candidatus Cloacimonadota bacterium]MBT6994125.1 DUF1232 domain-containing protein [Candidatus Cloacimonadota bacterium]MBT7469835.1 DUF1232 domain-containing protein [Candidatus Cloacimonadota bacterium]